MEKRAPSLFVSHGAPTELIRQGPWQLALEMLGRGITPRAVVVMSAHWRSRSGFDVGFQEAFETIHDFSGFPPELSQFRYPARGDLDIARQCLDLFAGAAIPSAWCTDRGLDHGVYVPLRSLWPSAQIPVIPIAISAKATPSDIFRAGEILAPLRDQNVMICGSGGLVHNLGELHWDNPDNSQPESWASEFHSWVTRILTESNYNDLCAFRDEAPHAKKAHPTWEHFAPLLFVAGAAKAADEIPELMFDDWTFGNLSMATWLYGNHVA